MRLLFILSLALLGVGCSSPPPETKSEPSVRWPDFSPPENLGAVTIILNQLPRADAPPATDAMVVVLATGASPQVHDDVLLTVWHHADRGEVWVQQSSGYPGVDIWFGPGPETLLPQELPVRQLVDASP